MLFHLDGLQNLAGVGAYQLFARRLPVLEVALPRCGLRSERPDVLELLGRAAAPRILQKRVGPGLEQLRHILGLGRDRGVVQRRVPVVVRVVDLCPPLQDGLDDRRRPKPAHEVQHDPLIEVDSRRVQEGQKLLALVLLQKLLALD